MAHQDPDHPVRVGMLGPLALEVGPRVVDIPRPKVRALLAYLSLSAGHVVGLDDLEDALWGSATPVSARKLVQTYVSWLRLALPPGTLVTRAPGYVLAVAPHRVDALRFEHRVRNAQRQASEERRADDLDAALREWRGRALEDVGDAAFAQPAAARLETARLDALEGCATIRLRMGDAGVLVPRLTAELGCQPYRERLAVLLMLALARLGRFAEALRVFETTADRLWRDLGLLPGPELRAARDGLLAGHLPRDPTELLADADQDGWVTVVRVLVPADRAALGVTVRRTTDEGVVSIRSSGEIRLDVRGGLTPA